MKWDKANKKRLQKLLEAKMKDIIPSGIGLNEAMAMRNANPNLTFEDLCKAEKDRLDEGFALQQRFFSDFGIKCDYRLSKKKDRIILEEFDMPRAWKKPKLSIPKDFAERFLVLGIP